MKFAELAALGLAPIQAGIRILDDVFPDLPLAG